MKCPCLVHQWMPRCRSCGKDVHVLCAEDGLCKDCSVCCRQEPIELHGLRDEAS